MNQSFVLELIGAQKFAQVDLLQLYFFLAWAASLLYVSAQLLFLSDNLNHPSCCIKSHLFHFAHNLVQVGLLEVHVCCLCRSCRMSFEDWARQVLRSYLYVACVDYCTLVSEGNLLRGDARQLLIELKPRILEFVPRCTTEVDLPSQGQKSRSPYNFFLWMVPLW